MRTFNEMARQAAAAEAAEDGDGVEIACKIVEEREKSLVIADGTIEEVVNHHTGELTEREKWFFLPLRLVTVTGNGTVRMPEWLAKDRGLI